jgi:hypothetical protein
MQTIIFSQILQTINLFVDNQENSQPHDGLNLFQLKLPKEHSFLRLLTSQNDPLLWELLFADHVRIENKYAMLIYQDLDGNTILHLLIDANNYELFSALLKTLTTLDPEKKLALIKITNEQALSITVAIQAKAKNSVFTEAIEQFLSNGKVAKKTHSSTSSTSSNSQNITVSAPFAVTKISIQSFFFKTHTTLTPTNDQDFLKTLKKIDEEFVKEYGAIKNLLPSQDIFANLMRAFFITYQATFQFIFKGKLNSLPSPNIHQLKIDLLRVKLLLLIATAHTQNQNEVKIVSFLNQLANRMHFLLLILEQLKTSMIATLIGEISHFKQLSSNLSNTDKEKSSETKTPAHAYVLFTGNEIPQIKDNRLILPPNKVLFTKSSDLLEYLWKNQITITASSTVFLLKDLQIGDHSNGYQFKSIPLNVFHHKLTRKSQNKLLYTGKTKHMLGGLFALPNVISKDKKTLNFGSTQYEILNRNTRNFSQKNIASVGEHPKDREIIIATPEMLAAEYQKFLSFMEAQEKQPQNTLEVLLCLQNYIRSKVFPYKDDWQSRLEQINQDAIAKEQFIVSNLETKIPVVAIKTHVEQQTAVCREHSLYVCYLLDYLIKQKKLPEGEVHHFRSHIVLPNKQKGGHAFCFYRITQPGPEQSQIYIIDTAHKIIKPLNDTTEVELRKHYGNEAANKLKNRCLAASGANATSSSTQTAKAQFH